MLAVMLPQQATGTEALTSSKAPADAKLAGAMVVRRNRPLLHVHQLIPYQ